MDKRPAVHVVVKEEGQCRGENPIGTMFSYRGKLSLPKLEKYKARANKKPKKARRVIQLSAVHVYFRQKKPDEPKN